MRYALEAVRAGKVRYLGFTGHKDPAIHLKMLAKPYAWTSAQMPLYAPVRRKVRYGSDSARKMGHFSTVAESPSD
jgi:hypothetical protein